MSQSDLAVHSEIQSSGLAHGTLAMVFPQCDEPDDSLFDVISSETFSLTELSCEDRRFVFNHPLPVHVVQEVEACIFESKAYNLLAFGHDRAEAESAFRHVFTACWDTIACKDDNLLTDGAKNMKRALLSLVKTHK